METPDPSKDSPVGFNVATSDEGSIALMNDRFDAIAEFIANTALEIDGVISVGVVDEETFLPPLVRPQFVNNKTIVVNCTNVFFATYLELFDRYTCRDLLENTKAKPTPTEGWPWWAAVRDSLARMTLGLPALFDISTLERVLRRPLVTNYPALHAVVDVREVAVCVHTDMDFQLVPQDIELFRGQMEKTHVQYGPGIDPRPAFDAEDIDFIRETAKQARMLNPTTGTLAPAS